MTKIFGCFFLILIMVTMPVMAAFVPCASENLNTEDPLMAMSASFEANQPAIHSPLQKHSTNKMQDCHSMTHCSVHLCSVHYYSSHYYLYSITVSPVYSHSENTLFRSFSPSPELRPPIS